jgi:hypothetical protein
MPHHVEIPAALGGLIEVREDAPNGFARILAFPLLLWRLWRPRNVGSDFGHVRYPASSQARTIVTCSKSCRLSVALRLPPRRRRKTGSASRDYDFRAGRPRPARVRVPCRISVKTTRRTCLRTLCPATLPHPSPASPALMDSSLTRRADPRQ